MPHSVTTLGNHEEGFKKEEKLRDIHSAVTEINEHLYQWRDFMSVAELINPELCAGAYERRPCRRKLRYIGGDKWPEPQRSEINAEGDPHFVHGGIYYSVDFNGATYSIEGYRSDTDKPRFIGLVYFEWLKGEEKTPLSLQRSYVNESRSDLMIDLSCSEPSLGKLKPSFEPVFPFLCSWQHS